MENVRRLCIQSPCGENSFNAMVIPPEKRVNLAVFISNAIDFGQSLHAP